MARPSRDTLTSDLFRDYRPEPVVERFDAEAVKAWNPAVRLAKAIALALDEAQMSREEIAAAMSDVLKSPISKAVLDGYASQAREQAISAVRLAALVEVTGDIRPLNTLLESSGLIVVPQKYEALLRREKAREIRDRAEREEQAADAEWKASKR